MFFFFVQEYNSVFFVALATYKHLEKGGMKEKKTNEREDRGRQCQLVRLRVLHASFSLLKSLWGRRDSGFLSAWAGMMGAKKLMIINREEESLLARFARTKGTKKYD